jgi:hypothetical protein
MKSFLLCLSILFLAACAFAKNVPLAWDPPDINPEIVTGYKIYYGLSPRTYTVNVNAGLVRTYTVMNLPAGTYYFTATAYDANGNESDYSNEVFIKFSGPPKNLVITLPSTP